MSGYHILIVDDARDVHDLVGYYLGLSGYRVTSAMDGEAGWRQVTAAPVDLVLLDIQMPVMDGFQLLSTLRNSPVTADIPVLMLSSLDRPNLKVKALQIGADDYIVKPFERNELLARVARALTRGERYRLLSGMMQGSLADVSLSDLLFTLELGRKSAVVTLEDARGDLAVVDGMLLQANWRGFSGLPALHRLLLTASGRFRVEFGPVFGGPTSSLGTLSAALLGAVVAIDEACRAFPDLAMLDRIVDAGPAGGQDARPDGVVSRTLRQALAETEGDLHRNAKTLACALEEGTLVLRPDPNKELSS